MADTESVRIATRYRRLETAPVASRVWTRCTSPRARAEVPDPTGYAIWRNLLAGLDDLLAEGEAGNGDELDVGHGQRDPDDGDGLGHGGGEVPMASQSPATRNQMMLLIPLMAPAPGAGTTSRPKGHRT